MRVSVVGSDGFCLGFKLAGVNAAYEMTVDEFRGRVDSILSEEEGVLIIEGGHMHALPERKRLEIQNAVDPVVIPLSEEAEDTDLRSKIKTAIGVDLWSKE